LHYLELFGNFEQFILKPGLDKCSFSIVKDYLTDAFYSLLAGIAAFSVLHSKCVMLMMSDAPGSRLIIYMCLEIYYGEDPVGTEYDTNLINPYNLYYIKCREFLFYSLA